MKTCAITGHRELPANFNKNALYEEIEELVRKGCDCFLCGMAEGFDLIALDCLSSLRLKYAFSVVACIPFVGQDARFSPENKKAYNTLLGVCDKKIYLSQNYYTGCFLARNRYMVENCDLLFAYCKKQTGGAHYTVNYAISKGVPVVYFEN